MTSRSCGTREGKAYWVNLEICGLICGFLTWVLLLYGAYATNFYVIIPWMGFSYMSLFHLIFYNASTVVAMYAHLKTMTTDPGAVPRAALPLPSDVMEMDHEANRVMALKNNTNNSNEKVLMDKFKKTCKRCAAFKPIRAHHCSICGRCVVKMDHHCPWVNNCVGIGNHKLFIVFLFWVNVVCWYSLILLACRVASCWRASRSPDPSCTDVNLNMGILFLFMEAVLFCLFTSCMMADQLSGAMQNQTQIDRLKNERHDVNSDVNEIFGSPLETRWHYTWIMPVAVEYAPAVKEKLYGYRLAAKVMESEGGGDCEEEKEFLLKALGEKESKVLDQEAHIGSVDGLVDIELGRDNSSSPYEGSTGSGNGGHAGSIRKRSGPP